MTDYQGTLSDWKKQKYSETDKHFDAALSQVLKAFQQSRGIVPSGDIDDLTLRGCAKPPTPWAPAFWPMNRATCRWAMT